MNEEFIPYEEALALKELGFNEPCFGYYYTLNGKDWKFAEKTEYYRLDDEINIGPKFSLLALTYSQAFRWFRENYPDLDFGVGKIYNGNNTYHYHINLRWEYFEGTYEEAELACLRKLIEIVKNDTKD